jgi:hypothetical protein
VISESQRRGYPRVVLNKVDYYKHRIIAIQFIPNPDNLPEIDHINHNIMDYHIENLRWVSKSQNQRNKRTYKGIKHVYIEYDDLPDDLICVDYYNEHEFEDYYYSIETNTFYYDTGNNCRVLTQSRNKNGSIFIVIYDVNHKKIQLCYKKFKRQHDISF